MSEQATGAYVPPPCWLTIPEFCKMRGINRATYYRWRDSGVIPPAAVSKKPGTRPRVNASAVFPEMFEIIETGIGRSR